MNWSDPNFYTTGGTLRQDARSYVVRQADVDLLAGLQGGEFCYVLTSRQMGKSSLMVRTAGKLREAGVRVVVLDLTAVGQNVTPEQWYGGLLTQIGRQLQLEDELDELWLAGERLGPCQRFFAAIRDVVLPAAGNPLVLFVDEIDAVRSLPFATDEFFAAIRECYNRRVQDAEFRRLTFCLLGVATPSDLIRDTRTTPFNIGRRIELHDFSEVESGALAVGMSRAGTSLTPLSPIDGADPPRRAAQRLLSRILHWTGGHPYLTQRFCRTVAEDTEVRDAAGVDRVAEALFFSHRAREKDDNLLFVRDRLTRNEVDVAAVLELYSKVLRGSTVEDDETSPRVSVLRLSGIVASVAGRLRTRNRIYGRVFSRAWVDAQMPDAELRRQKAAYNRGVARAAAIAALVIALLTIAALVARHEARNARRALAGAYVSQARASRTSGLAGQRIASLAALGKARAEHPNLVELRDEALASLALIDLQESDLNRQPNVPQAAEISPGLEATAKPEPDGGILVQPMGGATAAVRLPAPAPAQAVEFIRLHEVGPHRFLAAAYRDTTGYSIAVWDWPARHKLFHHAAAVRTTSVDLSSDGQRLAVGRADGRVSIVSIPTGEQLHEWTCHSAAGNPRVPAVLRFNPAGNQIAITSLDDHLVEIWDVTARQQTNQLFHPAPVNDIAWHPLGYLLASACDDSRVHLWDTNDLRTSRKLAAHEAGVSAVAFNQRGTLLASAGKDETLRLWVPGTGRHVSLATAGNTFTRMRFVADDGKLVASDGTPVLSRVWDVARDDAQCLPVRTFVGDELRSVDFSPDNRWILGITGHRITFWEAASGREIGSSALPNISTAAFSADGEHILGSGDSGLYRWPWRPSTGPGVPGLEFPTVTEAGRYRLDGNVGGFGIMALAADRKTLVVVHHDEIFVTPALPGRFQTNRPVFLGAHFPQLTLHPAGKWLAARSSESNALHLWNLAELERLPRTDPPAAPTPAATVSSSHYFAFSPDGSWLGVCWDHAFRFYRTGTWDQPALIIARQSASDLHAPLAFASDGRTVAIAATRYAVQLVRLPARPDDRPFVFATLEAPDRLPIEILAFSPDSRRLAAATNRQIVELWNLAGLHQSLAGLQLQQDWRDFPPGSESSIPLQ